ncbi:MAG: 2Fe-2S iron-sulfur cluster-binding protein [Pseudomonadota bacterium]
MSLAETPRPAQPVSSDADDHVVSIVLSVNGERHRVTVPARTQLAEILRDHLHLTGTHLGCEQGVCGACTVMIDGVPARSCIRFAGSCDGISVETIEGFSGDDLMHRLRRAFSEHHALQCGFCTPGMIVTARDIVDRLDAPDETRIRHELSGNLCRCTGYVGIVEAIADVIVQRNEAGLEPLNPAVPVPAGRGGFQPFRPTQTADSDVPAIVGAATGDGVRRDGIWTVVSRTVMLDHPPDAVWAHFSDLPEVAACIPGAELGEMSGERFDGRVAIRFGPISAAFEGDGTYALDEAAHSGRLTGKGRDKGGQSNLTGDLAFTVSEGHDAGASTVSLELRFALEGMLAQFNRPELVTGFVDYVLGEFIANCSAVLSGGTARKARPMSAFALLGVFLKSQWRRLFGPLS